MNIHWVRKNHTKREVVASSRFWVGHIHWVEVWRLADILKIVFRTKCQMMGALHHARATCAADANEANSHKAMWGWMTTVLLKELNISTYIFNTSQALCFAWLVPTSPSGRIPWRNNAVLENWGYFYKGAIDDETSLRIPTLDRWHRSSRQLCCIHIEMKGFLKPKQLYYSYLK